MERTHCVFLESADDGVQDTAIVKYDEVFLAPEEKRD